MGTTALVTTNVDSWRGRARTSNLLIQSQAFCRLNYPPSPITSMGVPEPRRPNAGNGAVTHRHDRWRPTHRPVAGMPWPSATRNDAPDHHLAACRPVRTDAPGRHLAACRPVRQRATARAPRASWRSWFGGSRGARPGRTTSLSPVMGSLIKKRRKRMRKKKHKKMLKATRWQRRAAGK
jgi:hypothetical protein